MWKKNFSLVPFLVLFLLVTSSYGRFSTKISEGEINTICSQSENLSFCFNFFKTNHGLKTLDILGVAKSLINYASQDALKTQKQFKSLEQGASDLRTKRIYSSCVGNFQNAVSDFDDALKALAAQDNPGVNINVSAAITEADTCNSNKPKVKINPQLLKKIYYIDNISAIVLVIKNITYKLIKYNISICYVRCNWDIQFLMLII